MYVHPPEHHERNHVSNMKGRGSRVYSTVYANSFVGKETVKLVSVTVTISVRVRGDRGIVPTRRFDSHSLFLPANSACSVSSRPQLLLLAVTSLPPPLGSCECGFL